MMQQFQFPAGDLNDENVAADSSYCRLCCSVTLTEYSKVIVHKPGIAGNRRSIWLSDAGEYQLYTFTSTMKARCFVVQFERGIYGFLKKDSWFLFAGCQILMFQVGLRHHLNLGLVPSLPSW